MSPQDSKQVVLDLVEKWKAYTEGWEPAKAKQVLAMFAEDFAWWHPTLGTLTKGHMEEMLGHQNAYVPDLKMSVVAITAEGDRVAAEMESQGTTAAGEPYHNYIHMLFVVSDGKIKVMKEYMDTLLVWKLFGSKLNELQASAT